MVTLLTPGIGSNRIAFMSGDRPQTRHKISPCARWDGENPNTDTSPSTEAGEIHGCEERRRSGRDGERERERRKNREDRGPVRRPVQNHPSPPCAQRGSTSVSARRKKKKKEGKRKTSPPSPPILPSTIIGEIGNQ